MRLTKLDCIVEMTKDKRVYYERKKFGHVKRLINHAIPYGVFIDGRDDDGMTIRGH